MTIKWTEQDVVDAFSEAMEEIRPDEMVARVLAEARNEGLTEGAEGDITTTPLT